MSAFFLNVHYHEQRYRYIVIEGERTICYQHVVLMASNKEILIHCGAPVFRDEGKKIPKFEIVHGKVGSYEFHCAIFYALLKYMYSINYCNINEADSPP